MKKNDAIEALAALAQDNRLDVFRLLVQAGPEGMSAGALSSALDIAPNALTFHFDRLRMAGLVSVRREGRSMIYAAQYATMNSLLNYLTENCCGGAASARATEGKTIGNAQKWRPEKPSEIFAIEEVEMTEIKEAVRQKYSQAALRAGSCCGTPALEGTSPITSNLYSDQETGELPEAAVLASLGCGNPTALAELKEGETVLDLGSGGGIDVLLSARRVGPSGKAYGLDMTEEMLALARENQKRAGTKNVEFLKGEIERIPLPDNSVDVIISNCVINLSADKDQVLREAFRVLKPGGRFAVSDVVTRGQVPERLRHDMLLWVGCIAGALEESEYRSKLKAAGFEGASIVPTRVYRIADAREILADKGIDVDAIAQEVDGKFMSAFIRAVKPGPF